MRETVLALLPWTAAALQAVLAAILFRRRLYRSGRLPFFSACTVYSVLAFVPLKAFAHQSWSYFVTYWASEAIYAVLALLALNEVFYRLFEPDYEEHRWFRFLLPGAALAIALLCLLTLLRHPPGSPFNRFAAFVYTFDLSVHIVEIGILVLFLLVNKFFLAPKSRYDFGILAGFGISASFTIVADVAGFYFGSNYESWFRYGPAIGYTLATAVWLGAFLRRPDREKPDPQRVQQLLDSMRDQSEFLDRLLRGLGLRRAGPGAVRFT